MSLEQGRRDTDDGEWPPLYFDALAYGVLRAGHALLPEPVGDDRDRIRIGTGVVAPREAGAQSHANAQHGEVTAAHQVRAHRRGHAPGAHTDGRPPRYRHVGEDGLLSPEIQEVRVGKLDVHEPVEVGDERLPRDLHQVGRIPDSRRGPGDQAVHHGIQRGVGADRHGEHPHRHSRQRGGAEQLADGVPQVLPKLVDPHHGIRGEGHGVAQAQV